MSLYQHISQRLTNIPLTTSLTTAVLSSSYFICGNLATAHFGIIPAIQRETNDNIPVTTKVQLWVWFYDRAKIHYSVSTTISTVSFCTAAYFTSSYSLRNILLYAAGCSSLVLPYTLIAMFPINNELFTIYNSLCHSKDEKVPNPNQRVLLEAQAVGRMNDWRKLHRVRLLLGASSWIAGLVAFMIHA